MVLVIYSRSAVALSWSTDNEVVVYRWVKENDASDQIQLTLTLSIVPDAATNAFCLVQFAGNAIATNIVSVVLHCSATHKYVACISPFIELN